MGAAAAENIVRRHQVLRDFFVEVLGVDEPIADEAACGMEHHVGRVVLRKLTCLAEYVAGGEEWLVGFQEFCRRREEAPAATKEAGEE